jgi:DNA recombination protein RmuC
MELGLSSVISFSLVLILLSFGVGYVVSKIRNNKRLIEQSLKLEQLTHQTSELEKSMKSLSEQLSISRSELHEKELSIVSLSTNLENANAQEKITKDELSRHIQRIQSLETDVNRLREQQHQAELSRETAMAEKFGLSKQVEELNININSLKLEIVSMEEKTGVLNDEIKLLNRQRATIEQDLEVERTRSDGLMKQNADLKTRLDHSMNELQVMRTQVDTLKDQLAEEGKKTKQSESAETVLREQLSEIKASLSQDKQEHGLLVNKYQTLHNEYTELKTTLEQREQQFITQLEQVNEAKSSLTKEFENLANRIFEEKGKTFTQTTQVGIDNLLKPFREQIDGFQKRVNEVHDASIQGQSRLDAEIKKVWSIEIGRSHV